MNWSCRLIRRHAGVVLAFALAASPPALAGDPPASGASGVCEVESVGITVSDIEQSVRFFTEVLDFETVTRVEVADESTERLTGVFGARCLTARLRLGEERVDLTQFLAPEGRPIPADSRSNDRWFQHIAIAVSDIDKAYRRLRTHNVRHASSGPQTLPAWNPNAAGISAFYFKDPDGHVLEIINFPGGKGDPRWQSQPDRLFLGIDHTAIVVEDTDRSLRFYRDTLGMTVAGGSENYGSEQEHLNNVFGARLRITTLRAAAGPGVELLEYLSPTDGRDYPADARMNDLVHWHTHLITPALDSLAQRFRETRTTWVTPGVVDASGFPIGLANGVHVRDPDGHFVLVGERITPAEHAAASGPPGTRDTR
ncbi:2-epi-5-epi-valiolone epimerase [Phycisphaerales bacterium]|nr:2-epi-5-epi-valiolone epimerase [Phycisphaerales bacterium]